MNEKQLERLWRTRFFSTLVISVIILSLLMLVPSNDVPLRTDGVYVTYYWPFDDGSVSYHEGFIPHVGVAKLELKGVCSEITKECRLPTEYEKEVNHYVPQSPLE